MAGFRSVRTVAVLLAASLCCSVPGAPAAQPPSLDDALKQIEAFAPQALQEQGAPGVSIAITDRTHTLRAINSVGLRRTGFNADAIRALRQAFAERG